MKTPIVKEIPEDPAAPGAAVDPMDRTETYDVSLIRRALAMERDGDGPDTPPAAA